jgi:hypothetical protein
MQNMPRDAVEGVGIRNLLMAAPGKKFVSADLSQIEPRISLLLTGDHEQLAMIRKGMCVYEVHARKTLGYNLPITMKEAAKKDDSVNKMRQFAKARCLSADTLVLTDSGYKPIINVHTSDLLWDGLEWVRHDGLIYRGIKPTHALHGDRYTDDHELFINETSTIPAGQAIRESALPVERFRESASDWNDVWQLARAILRMAAQRWLQVFAVRLRAVRRGVRGHVRQPSEGVDQELPGVWQGSSSPNPQHAQVGQA